MSSSSSLKPRQVSTLPGTGLKKRKPKARKKPAWDSTVTDLSALKLSPEELDRRKRVHQSQNMDLVKQEKLRRHVAKLHQQKQLASGGQSTQSVSSLLRNILYGNDHLYEALETSDRLMSSVKDLLGDNTKKFLGLPLVTKAPNHSELDRSLPEVADVMTRLDLNSELVMDKSALNDIEDQLNSSSSSSVSPDDDHSATNGYRSVMDIARFQQLIQEAELDQLIAMDSAMRRAPALSKEARKLENSRPTSQQVAVELQQNGTTTDGRRGAKPAVVSGQEKGCDGNQRIGENIGQGYADQGGGDGWTPVSSPRIGSAINDTERVRRTRSVFSDRSQPSTATASLGDFNQMLENVQRNLADCGTSDGLSDSFISSQRPSTYSGYTMALLDAVVKMSMCLKQSEMRARADQVTKEQLIYEVQQLRGVVDALAGNEVQSRADKAATEQLTCEVQQLHGIVDALTADILAVQEEYSRLKNEFVKYRRDAEMHWRILSQTMTKYGVQLQLPILQQQPTQMMNQRIVVQTNSVEQRLQQQPVSLASSHKSVSVNGFDDDSDHVSLPGRSPLAETSPPGSRCVASSSDGVPAAEPRQFSALLMHDSTPAPAGNGGNAKMVSPTVASSIVGPAALDQQMFDIRREAIRRQMTELSRQRQLAQAKVDELKRQQIQLNEKPKVSPSISPITVASDPSGITFTTQISTDAQLVTSARPGNTGVSTRRVDIKIPTVDDS